MLFKCNKLNIINLDLGKFVWPLEVWKLDCPILYYYYCTVLYFIFFYSHRLFFCIFLFKYHHCVVSWGWHIVTFKKKQCAYNDAIELTPPPLCIQSIVLNVILIVWLREGKLLDEKLYIHGLITNYLQALGNIWK